LCDSLYLFDYLNAIATILSYNHKNTSAIISNSQYVVARRAFALPDEAIPLLLGDCFGKNQERLAATLFIMRIAAFFGSRIRKARKIRKQENFSF